MGSQKWQFLDVEALLNQPLPEQTTTANVGAYPVPLGRPLRRVDLTGLVPDGIPEEMPDEIRKMLGLPSKRRK